MRQGKSGAIQGILIIGILLLLWTGWAQAEREAVLKAACPSRGAEQVLARKGWNGYVLSLPGFWDPREISLELEGGGKLFLGDEGQEIPCGGPVDLTPWIGRRIALRNEAGGAVGNLTILQGSEIPCLFLEADAEQLDRIRSSKENEITDGWVVFRDADGSVDYHGALSQLRGRGKNTFSYMKKPYQLKLARKASLGGMRRGKTWVLLANWTDVSLLRNQIVLDMSREIGLPYAVDCRQTDVWINGIYQGLYLLTEKIQIGEDRIPVSNLEKETEKVNDSPMNPGKLVKERSEGLTLMRSYPAVRDPEDVTGGYIMTVEKLHRMKNYRIAGFLTEDGLSIHIKEPTYPSRAQTAYLGRRLTETQHALMAKDGVAPETGKSFEEYLDVTSFAQKFLIEDWSKNYDLLGGSQFLWKDSDETDPRIHAGPAWDYDLSFGNMKDRGYPSGGSYVTGTRRSANLYWLLYGHEGFRTEVRRIWRERFRPALEVLLGKTRAEENSVLRSLEEYRDRIEASAQMNYARWRVSSDATGHDAGGSFENAVRYLRQWIEGRETWMDGEYGALEASE